MSLSYQLDYQMEELVPIVADLAQRYTGCDSTSVTYEKAQSFMEAVLYCLGEYRNAGQDYLADGNLSVKQQYQIGMELVQKKAEAVSRIFNEISVDFMSYGVICLQDTIQKGIPAFLKWYDVRYCPQDTILTLDYPLLYPQNNLCGVDAVYQYLCGVQLEQQFLQQFADSYVQSVLEQYCADYRYMVENICDIVLTNTIGHLLLGESFHAKTLNQRDYRQITAVLEKYSLDELEQIIKILIGNLVKQYYQNALPLQEYLEQDARNIAVRIDLGLQQQQLEKIFVL